MKAWLQPAGMQPLRIPVHSCRGVRQLQAKALLDRISPAVTEPPNVFVCEQEILAARLKLFWAGVPPAWTDFARSCLQELNIKSN